MDLVNIWILLIDIIKTPRVSAGLFYIFYIHMGIHTVAPSMGPFTSAWDRACEVYAQLVGGTVDYGKAHSEKYGHERYGRT